MVDTGDLKSPDLTVVPVQVRPRAPLFTRPPALLPKFTNLKYSHSRRIVDINLCDGFASSGENGAADPVRDECLRIFAGLNTEGKKRAVKGLIALFKINTGTVAGITGSILRDTSK